MRFVLMVLVSVSVLFGECVLVMTQNKDMAKRFGTALHQKGYKVLQISSLDKHMSIKDDTDALFIVQKSGCAYAMYMPMKMRSRNENGMAEFYGEMKLYKKEKGVFEDVPWEEKVHTEVIDLLDKNASKKIKDRFVQMSVKKADEYFQQ